MGCMLIGALAVIVVSFAITVEILRWAVQITNVLGGSRRRTVSPLDEALDYRPSRRPTPSPQILDPTFTHAGIITFITLVVYSVIAAAIWCGLVFSGVGMKLSDLQFDIAFHAAFHPLFFLASATVLRGLLTESFFQACLVMLVQYLIHLFIMLLIGGAAYLALGLK